MDCSGGFFSCVRVVEWWEVGLFFVLFCFVWVCFVLLQDVVFSAELGGWEVAWWRGGGLEG